MTTSPSTKKKKISTKKKNCEKIFFHSELRLNMFSQCSYFFGDFSLDILIKGVLIKKGYIHPTPPHPNSPTFFFFQQCDLGFEQQRFLQTGNGRSRWKRKWRIRGLFRGRGDAETIAVPTRHCGVDF